MTTYLIESVLGTLEGGIPNSEPIHDLLVSIAAAELPFLAIQRADSPQIYIQVFLEVEGVCLEHREGGPDRHFASRGVTVDQAHAAIMSWARETEEWRTCVPWQKAEP